MQSSNEMINRAHVICVANNKGGVGKTSTTINLAAALALAGKKTCVVDLDAQCSAGKGLGLRPDDMPGGFTTLDSLVHGVPLREIMIPLTGRFNDRLWLAPGHPGLRNAPEIIREEYHQLLREGKTTLSGAQFERQHINRLHTSFACEHGLDFIVIDTPPDIGFHLTSALYASRWLLITMFADGDSIDGLNDITEYANTMIEDLNIDLQLLGVLLGNTRKNVRIMQDILDRLIEAFGYESALLKTMIPQRTRLAEGRYGGKPVFEYCPGEDICQAFTDLAAELLTRISVLCHDLQVDKEIVNG